MTETLAKMKRMVMLYEWLVSRVACATWVSIFGIRVYKMGPSMLLYRKFF